ncbi:hypothetical protein CUJ84_pRLN3000049 (plasmid) [Rhizobium leguminosarum]|uniref:Uncharacterized protein n=1 Tax=Rhizobium leguminosarum TaxID=384 RepID=A0A2K9ZG08_RHILE|nr:hypothetical protein CUJ84_pRLN3000049 [Rhizobium leguminosarum]
MITPQEVFQDELADYVVKKSRALALPVSTRLGGPPSYRFDFPGTKTPERDISARPG